MVKEIGTPKLKEPEQTLEDEFKDFHLNLPVLEVLAHAPMYNVILDKYVESLELGKNGPAFIQDEMPKKMKDLVLFILPCRLGDSKPFDTLADSWSCVNLIPLYLFKKLKIGLLEETDHVFGLADGTKSYPVGILKNVEVRIGRLNLLEDFCVIDIEKDSATPLLVGRGFLATASAVIDCRKAKIVVGEGITMSIFGVKEINLGDKETPYWTTLGKRESYTSRPSTDGIGARTPYYARKDFMDYHLPREWQISRDSELNPFKDILVFRKMSLETASGLILTARDAEVELDHEGSKKQKTNEASGSVQEQPEEEETKLPQEDLQQMMMVVPVEEVYVEALQVKYPIIDWEVYSEDTRKYWKIIRVGNHTEAYQTFDDMLKKFDRDDLDKLWSLVKERFSSTDPTDDKERTLWVELKRLFEPDTDDILWKLQRYMHDPLTWRLYDTCGVHHVSTDRGHDIFMLVEKDYPLTRGILTLMLCNKLQVDQYSKMADGLLRKIVILANKPRQ
ncbi:MAK10-like protein [Tanacetum coccineum]